MFATPFPRKEKEKEREEHFLDGEFYYLFLYIIFHKMIWATDFGSIKQISVLINIKSRNPISLFLFSNKSALRLTKLHLCLVLNPKTEYTPTHPLIESICLQR